MKASIAAGHHSHWARRHGTANDAARLDEGPLTGAKAKMAGHIWPTVPLAKRLSALRSHIEPELHVYLAVTRLH